MSLTLADYDSRAIVSDDLAVVRYGKVWRVYDRPSAARASDGAEIGPAFSSKAVAIAYALRLIERGDYS